MRVCCPNCNTAFEYQLLEEVLKPTVSITRVTQDRSSWQDIIELVRTGCSYRLFNVGDVISFKLKDDTNFEMEIAGIDIYAPNTVVLVAKNCLQEDLPMNERTSYSEHGGWSECKIRSYLNDKFYKLLPDDFASVIIPRTIVQQIGNDKYTSVDKLWLPSQTELFADKPNSMDVGDKHFPLYSTDKSRSKTRVNEGDTLWYWLRTPYSIYGTPYSIYGTHVFNVNPSGSLNCNNAAFSSGIAPACIIG